MSPATKVAALLTAMRGQDAEEQLGVGLRPASFCAVRIS
jgi:hypothetical protein